MQIKNKYISFLFDLIDAPVRFIYCRTGYLSRILNKILFWKLYSSDYSKVDNKFMEMYEILKKNKIDFKNKVVLEIGPGNSYINAYNFLILGVKKVILVDKFPRNIETKKQKAFFKAETNYIKRKYKGRDLFFLDKDGLKPGYIEFINKELTEIKGLQVDFIYSLSVLEHIKSIKENIEKMADILKASGYMYHTIFMCDHYNLANPFLFYKYSDEVWNKYLTKEGLSYTNRLRYNDFMNEFTANGLKTVFENKIKYSMESVKINKIYEGRDDLDIGELKVMLKKS